MKCPAGCTAERRISRRIIGLVLANTNVMTSQLPQLEILIGRSLAMCAHPYAAWRSHSTKGRLLVLFAYGAASYVIMLGALLAL